MLRNQLLLAISLSGLFACAASQEGTGSGDYDESVGRGDCIFESSIRGYSVLNEQNLVIEASGRRNYHVTLRRPARGIRSSWQIAFDSPSSRICSRFSEIVFKGHFDNESIRIDSIRELSPEEHEDLLIEYGKREPEIKQTPEPREVKGAEVEELDPNAVD